MLECKEATVCKSICKHVDVYKPDSTELTEASLPLSYLSPELDSFIINKKLTPVLIYDNLSNITRTTVLNETRNLSGIYLILKKFSLDYIGSASTGKYDVRFINHFIKFKCKVVKKAVKKNIVYLHFPLLFYNCFLV
jgi:hypothetical protein